MAAGEYVSVSAQSDTERADTARALQVAERLTAHDALGAHLRDELDIAEHQRARPVQAAVASAATFTVGAALPLIAGWLSPVGAIAWIVTATSLVVMVALGAVAAGAEGASALTGALRVSFWGAFAMALTYGVGRRFGAVI